jgi:hypothetical protein
VNKYNEDHLHSFIRFNREQMVVTPRQMRGAHDHEATDITIRRDIAHFCQTSRTEEPLALYFGMADTETRRGGIGQAGGESHYHEISRRVGSACSSRTGDNALSGGRDQFKEEVLKVSFVEGDAELAFLDQWSRK